MAKQAKSMPPEPYAPIRLARHLQESDPAMIQECGKLTLYFHDEAKALQAFWLIHEVMGREMPEQSLGEVNAPSFSTADSFARPHRAQTPSGSECM